jgi:hypothetical protein
LFSHPKSLGHRTPALASARITPLALDEDPLDEVHVEPRLVLRGVRRQGRDVDDVADRDGGLAHARLELGRALLAAQAARHAALALVDDLGIRRSADDGRVRVGRRQLRARQERDGPPRRRVLAHLDVDVRIDRVAHVGLVRAFHRALEGRRQVVDGGDREREDLVDAPRGQLDVLVRLRQGARRRIGARVDDVGLDVDIVLADPVPLP